MIQSPPVEAVASRRPPRVLVRSVLVLAIAIGALGAASSTASAAGCFSAPASCGYPSATTAGVPAGTALTASGSRTLSTNGQVLSGVELTGSVTVTADNVTIRNSRLHTTSGGSGSTVITLANGADNFTLENSEIAGNGSRTNAPESAVWNHYNNPGARVIGSYIHGSPDNWEGAVALVKDSFMLVDAKYSGAHSENIYICGAGAVVEHSTVYNTSDETSLIFGDGICGRGNPVTVTNSLLAGGGYMLQPDSKGVSAPVRITGNRVGRCVSAASQDSGGGYVCAGGADANGYWPRGGHYGISTELGNEAVWSGNVWDDTGQAVCASGSPGCGSAVPPPVVEPPAPPPTPPPVETPPVTKPKPTETPKTGSGGSGSSSGGESHGSGGGSGASSGSGTGAATAVWSAPSPQVGATVTLDGTRSVGAGSPDCTWTFRDRSGQRVAPATHGCRVQHRFGQQGVEYVTLTVQSADGSAASLRRAVHVRPRLDRARALVATAHVAAG